MFFSSMEIIMTRILEEREDIELELISPILACLEKNNQNIQPISRRLAENIFGKCAASVRPCLLEAKSSMNLFLDDYSPIITEICKETNHLPGEQLDRETRASSLDTFPNMGDGKSSWNDGEGTSRPIVTAMTSNPLVESPNQRARHAALIFDVEKEILQCMQIYICNLWKCLTRELSKCLLKDFGLFEEGADQILKAMEEVKGIDVSLLRKMVFDFFVKAREYDQQCSLFLDMSFMESQKNIFKEKLEQLKAILSEESCYKNNVADFKERLAVIATQIKSLNDEEDEVQIILANEENEISQAQVGIASLNSDLTKLEDQYKQLDKIESNLEKLSKFLQNELEELINLKPFL